MALANYELDLITHVATEVAVLTLGTNAFAGPLRSPADGAPQRCVGCLLTGGIVPVELLDGSNTRLYLPSLQIMVRSNPGAYQAGRDLAEQVYVAAHNGAVAGYQWVRCLQGSPIYVGSADNRNHYFSVNVEMAKVES